MMEQARYPRRIASHGALQNGSSSHGGPCVGRSPLHPLHKPLRCVNENSVLLRSPGALESMLKTTTETGDIGIFTIKPVPPSPLRDTRHEMGYPHPRPFHPVDNGYRQNQALRSPSHHDNASEAFSVHGSESLKSIMSTLSPNSTEDLGKRSYSMTTCGSRHLSHCKSTNTLQSQASGGSNLQRPRSPFPYPTRLKRPGVRPSSPAVTENGQVDYSRMVEIDRVSYRPLHSQVDQAYSPMARRPQPLGLRADVNRSTPSLVPPGPPPNLRGPPRPPSSSRTFSPASMISRNPPFHERCDSTSMRTSSLTSVTNMQRRMLPAYKSGHPGAARRSPRYYDYSEEFENKPPRSASSSQHYVTPPPRTIKYHRSMMLREDSNYLATGHLNSVFGEGDSAFDCESQAVDEQDVSPVLIAAPDCGESSPAPNRVTPCDDPNSPCSQNGMTEFETPGHGRKKTKSSDIDLLPSQIGRSSIDTFRSSLDFEPRGNSPTYNYATNHANTNSKAMTKSPERHVQVSGGQAPTIRSEQGVIFRDDTHYDVTGKESPDDPHTHVDGGADKMHSPNQSSEAPVVEHQDNEEVKESCTVPVRDEAEPGAQSTGNGGLDASTVSDSPQPERPRSLSMGEAATTPNATAESCTKESLPQIQPKTNLTQSFRRHRRKPAALRISTSDLPRDDNEGHPHMTPTCSTVPLMSPKPISPARQLKVKNSIPRLMKALPPLPDTLGYDLPLTTIGVPEVDDFADILIPFGFQGSNDNLSTDQPQSPRQPQTTDDRMSPNSERNRPKFRLKIKTSTCSESSDKREWYTDEEVPRSERLPSNKLDDGFGAKLVRSRHRPNKMKVRGRRRSTLSASHSSTVRHHPGVERPRVVTELLRQNPNDLFSVPPQPEAVMMKRRGRYLPKLVYPQATVTSTTSNSNSSEERIVSTSYHAPSTISASNTEMPSIERDTIVSSMPPHGLRKRLSNLRALLTSSINTSGSRARARNSLKLHRISSNALSSFNFGFEDHVKTSSSMRAGSMQLRVSQRIRARLFRWVRGAKTGMRKRANTKHSQLGSEGIEQT